MLRRKLMLLSAVSAGLVLLAQAGTVAGMFAGKTYKVDGAHSSLIFHVKHMNVSYFNGRFNAISGSLAIDDQNPTASSFEFTVKTDSIDTASSKRDGHLKSPDFFNARQFPTISFKSKSVTKAGENTFDVEGDLTMHGVTKPVTLKLEQTGQAAGRGGSRVGFETVFTVKRSDYGMTKMLDAVGDEVRITADIEAMGP